MTLQKSKRFFSADVGLDGSQGRWGRPVSLGYYPTLGHVAVGVEGVAENDIPAAEFKEFARALLADEINPEIERTKYFGHRDRSKEYVRQTGGGYAGRGEYEVGDRMGADSFEGREPITVTPGLLGDSLVLQRDGFKFTIGLASVEAIVKAADLKPGPEVTIEPEPEPKPEWLDAKIIRADHADERILLSQDSEGDFMFLGGRREFEYISSDNAEAELSDVEIVASA